MLMKKFGRHPTPHTDQQLAGIAYACYHTRLADWSAPPLTPGKWRELDPDLAATTLASASVAQPVDLILRESFAQKISADRVRMTVLPCWPEAALIEVQGHDQHNGPGIAGMLVSAADIWLLDGTSAPIHNASRSMRLLLDTSEQRLSYLHLFMNWVRGESGRFRPLEDVSSLAARLTDASAAEKWASLLTPLAEVAVDPPLSGAFQFEGAILYADVLFAVTLRLYANGAVKMIKDQPIPSDLPVKRERTVGMLLVELNAKPGELTDNEF